MSLHLPFGFSGPFHELFNHTGESASSFLFLLVEILIFWETSSQPHASFFTSYLGILSPLIKQTQKSESSLWYSSIVGRTNTSVIIQRTQAGVRRQTALVQGIYAQLTAHQAAPIRFLIERESMNTQ